MWSLLQCLGRCLAKVAGCDFGLQRSPFVAISSQQFASADFSAHPDFCRTVTQAELGKTFAKAGRDAPRSKAATP